DGLPDGPFRGVPFLLKDLTAVLAGVPMTRGSRFFADSPPAAADSEHVKRLKRAGLVFFGRTNSCELGLSLTCEPQLYGPTRTPRRRGRGPAIRTPRRRRPVRIRPRSAPRPGACGSRGRRRRRTAPRSSARVSTPSPTP